ncbi:hypothetical protein [Aeromonas veronii]|uniref:hypothetical protein n=1 Tax=Aeromonas veronii TaxID=654 RepID=UPI001FD6E8D0|nr:hypothetical protein [Aeromonas veronii]MCJ8217236.1 hypothetical protein [Aeromonas veronii]
MVQNKYGEANQRLCYLIALITLSSYDSLVLPGVRLSVADTSVLFLVLLSGFSLSFFKNNAIKLLFFWLVVLLSSILNSLGYELTSGVSVSFIKSISGLLRPIFFSMLAALFLSNIQGRKTNTDVICFSFLFAGCIVSFIVALQFFGLYPAMYFNNPSFGEVGRWMLFSEGWRPTGLSNEASFVGIYILLMMTFSFYLKSEIYKRKVNVMFFICSLGCFFTTSRIAFVFSLALMFFKIKGWWRIFIFIPILMMIYAFFDLTRITNLFEFSGDASTLERYGSNIAYYHAWINNILGFSPGYLNGEVLVSNYIDPLVLEVLNGRDLPAFSTPLQLLVEFGASSVILFFLLVHHFTRGWLFSYFFVTILCVSMTTGIQNFLFVYIFIAGSLYVKSSHSS